MKLEPENQFVYSNESLARVLDQYGLRADSFEYIHQGVENSSVRVVCGAKAYVLRVYKQGKDARGIGAELAFMRYLSEHGIPVPTVHTNTSGDGCTTIEFNGVTWYAILMDFVPGLSETPNPSPALICDLAHIQARMHLLGETYAQEENKARAPWTELRDGLVAGVNALQIADSRIRGLVHRIQAFRYPLSTDLPYGINHLDVDFDGNVITAGDKVVAVVDFDDTQYSPVVVCLGYTLWDFLADHGEDTMRTYLRAYEEVRPVSEVEYDALHQVLMFRNYAIAAMYYRIHGEQISPDVVEKRLRMEKEIPNVRFR